MYVCIHKNLCVFIKIKWPMLEKSSHNGHYGGSDPSQRTSEDFFSNLGHCHLNIEAQLSYNKFKLGKTGRSGLD